MADIFQVISDATRREILLTLLEGYPAGTEMSVSELVAALNVSQPTVSKHLKVLRDAELVRVREEGQHRLYSLDPEPLTMVEDFVMPFLTSGIQTDVTVEYVTADGTRVDPHGNVAPEGALAVASQVGRAAATARHQVTELVARFKLR